MAGETTAHTLQPTALVHEAWLRLVGNGTPQWNSREWKQKQADVDKAAVNSKPVGAEP